MYHEENFLDSICSFIFGYQGKLLQGNNNLKAKLIGCLTCFIGRYNWVGPLLQHQSLGVSSLLV